VIVFIAAICLYCFGEHGKVFRCDKIIKIALIPLTRPVAHPDSDVSSSATAVEIINNKHPEIKVPLQQEDYRWSQDCACTSDSQGKPM
jgi:branched-chain amino acid transport system substrate-binding protein